MKNSTFSLKTWVALSLLIVSFLMNTAFANHYHLLTISTETGAGTLIAPLDLPVTAQAAVVLTCDSAGQLYAWSEWSSGTDDDLLRVDKNTGAVFEYPDAGLSTYTQSLDFNNSNILYLLNGSQTIYTVSMTTGLPTSVGTSASPIANHGKFNPITDQLWAIDEAYNTNPRDIVILDIPSGTIVNTLPTVDDLHTLAFAPLSHIDTETRLIRALGKKRLIYQKGLYP